VSILATVNIYRVAEIYVYSFVDLPFSPSGVTHLIRLHRSVGFERELREVAEVLKVAKEGNNNVLAVVVAPYGWGKSELLDEIEVYAVNEGFDVVRTALSLEGEFTIEAASKKRDRPMLVLIDEADEISRVAAAHKLGALSDERFVKLIQKVATYIRALLEPRSYRHILGDPERFNKIAIIVALTPHLYYTILKNVVPDVFDITTGRVYREIVLDTRFPFWQFVETVKQRLLAYSSQERLKKIENGDIDPLSPFTLYELAAVYHLAKRRGEVAPRPLMKLVARLFQLKKEGKRLADLIREEGINPDLDDEVLELAFAGVPYVEKTPYSKEVYLYKVPYEDKESLNILKEYALVRGKDIDIKDMKNLSYEPYLYFTLLEGGRLYIYIAAEEDLQLDRYLIGKRYLVSDDVARLIGLDEVQTVTTVAREMSQKLENPLTLLEEVEHTIGVDGIRLRFCCGYVIWQNNMGIREAYIFIHVDREDELRKVVENIEDLVSRGAINGYVVDYVNLFITSKVLLTETIHSALAPLMSAYWKRLYPEPTSNYATLQIYGADRFEKLKHDLVRYAVDRLLKRETKLPEFVDLIRLGREKVRENLLRYTLALRRGKEKKQLVLIRVAEALDEGQEVEGLKSYRQIEEILLNAFEESIHEKELKSLVNVLFPTNLWRELREDDLIELMKLRGVVVPGGDRLYKYREDLARRYLAEVVRQIEMFSEVSIEKSTPFGVIRLTRKIETETLDVSFKDRKTYAKALREALQRLLEVREKFEEIRKELEKEAEEKARLLKRISAVLEKYPQRSKFIELGRLDEHNVKKEELIAQKADEALKIWDEIKHMAKTLGSKLDVEGDLAILLELPEPWLEEYVANLKLYATEISRRYEKYIEQEKARKAVAEWLREKFGVFEGDVDKALFEVAVKLAIDKKLLEAIARRGRGAVLDIDELAKETGLGRSEVEEGLEKLYKVGAVDKRYVA
jgi:hypothetical protein